MALGSLTIRTRCAQSEQIIESENSEAGACVRESTMNLTHLSIDLSGRQGADCQKQCGIIQILLFFLMCFIHVVTHVRKK